MLDNESVKFGKIIKRLRKSKLLSQEELAFRSEIDRKYMSDLERDVSKPGLLTFIHLAIALEMEPSELMKELENSLPILKNQTNDDTE